MEAQHNDPFRPEHDRQRGGLAGDRFRERQRLDSQLIGAGSGEPRLHGLDELAREFFAEAPSVKKAGREVKTEFVRDCWRRAEDATERWIARLEQRNYFVEHAAYRDMWDRFNREGNFSLA